MAKQLNDVGELKTKSGRLDLNFVVTAKLITSECQWSRKMIRMKTSHVDVVDSQNSAAIQQS